LTEEEEEEEEEEEKEELGLRDGNYSFGYEYYEIISRCLTWCKKYYRHTQGTGKGCQKIRISSINEKKRE
jgi:hypothetical protein